MKRIALLLAGLGFCLLSQAEEPVRNFYFPDTRSYWFRRIHSA